MILDKKQELIGYHEFFEFADEYNDIMWYIFRKRLNATLGGLNVIDSGRLDTILKQEEPNSAMKNIIAFFDHLEAKYSNTLDLDALNRLSIIDAWRFIMKLKLKALVKSHKNISYETFINSWVHGNRNISFSFKALASSADHELVDINVPTGLVLIGGLSNTGKSTLLRSLAKVTRSEYVVFGEPDFPSLTSNYDLVELINNFIDSEKKVLFLDGISRFLVASGKVAAAAGGINNELLIEFPTLSNALGILGKTIVTTINYGEKMALVDNLHNAYLGKVSCYIKWDKLGSGTISSRLSRSREEMPFTIPFDEQDAEGFLVPESNTNNAKQVKPNFTEKRIGLSKQDVLTKFFSDFEL